MKLKKNLMVALGVLSAAFLTGGGVISASASQTNDHALCQEYCLVCDVAEKVNALPDASEITLENALAVTQQIHNIDRIKFDMTDEEYDEFALLVQKEGYGHVVKYENAVDAIRKLNAGNSLYVQKKFDLNGETLSDTSDAEVSFAVKNLSNGQTDVVTLFDLGATTSALGAEYYEMTSDGWTYLYKLPDGEYSIEEIGLENGVEVNGARYSFACTETTVDGVSYAGNGGTFTLSGDETVRVNLTNSFITADYVFVDGQGNGISGVTVQSGAGQFGPSDASGKIMTGMGADIQDTLTVLSADGYCIPETISYQITGESDLSDMDGNPIENLSLAFENNTYTFTLVLNAHRYENGFCEHCDAYQAATKTVGTYDFDGDSSTDDVVYEIANAGQLYWFASLVNGGEYGANGAIVANVTVNENVLTAEKELNGDGSDLRVWTPIGNGSNAYTGTLFGGNLTVSGLYFNDAAANDVGLFSFVSGKVRGVKVADSYFNANERVGGIVGKSTGVVEFCENSATVKGVEDVGGIVGYLEYNKITACANKGKITGSGIVGNAHPGTVSNCYSVGEVTGSGIAGKDYANGVSNCYYLSGSATGGIDGADVDGFAQARTAEQFKSGEVAFLLNSQVTDGTQSWYQTLGTHESPVVEAAAGTVYYGYVDCGAEEKTYANTPLSETVIPHTYGEWVAEVPATCEADGCKGYYHCSVCDKYFDENKAEVEEETLLLPMLGHAYSEWEITKEPTMDEGGLRKKVCANCGDVVEEELPSKKVEMFGILIAVAALLIGGILVGTLVRSEDRE